MSHSQFHSISSLYLDMHGLIFERLIDREAGLRPSPVHLAMGSITTVPVSSPALLERLPLTSHISVGTDYILSLAFPARPTDI